MDIENKREEIVCSEIVDPRQGGLRGCNDIFFVKVVKKSEFHGILPKLFVI